MEPTDYEIYVKFADNVLCREYTSNSPDTTKFIEVYKRLEMNYFINGSDERQYNMFKELWEYRKRHIHDFAVSDRLSQTHREIQQDNREILNKLGSAIHSIKESILVGSGKFEYKEKKKKGGRNNYCSDSD